MTDLTRRSLAELAGTALLVLFGAGSVVATLTVDGQIAYPSWGFIGLAFALVIALVVYGFGPVSGAHINPAVTIALALSHRFAWADVIPYVVAQLIGGFIGGVLIVVIFGIEAVDLEVGATMLSDTTYWQGIVAEALGTFILLFAVMALAVDKRAPSGWAGPMIGLAVGLQIMLIGPLTGGSVNPARTFGPYLTITTFGGDAPWSQFGVYIAGPVIGGIIAVYLYDFIAQPRDMEEAAANGSQMSESSDAQTGRR